MESYKKKKQQSMYGVLYSFTCVLCMCLFIYNFFMMVSFH